MVGLCLSLLSGHLLFGFVRTSKVVPSPEGYGCSFVCVCSFDLPIMLSELGPLRPFAALLLGHLPVRPASQPPAMPAQARTAPLIGAYHVFVSGRCPEQRSIDNLVFSGPSRASPPLNSSPSEQQRSGIRDPREKTAGEGVAAKKNNITPSALSSKALEYGVPGPAIPDVANFPNRQR